MSPNFSNFLVYRTKSLKMALKVFKCAHKKPTSLAADTMSKGVEGGKESPALSLWLLGFAGSPLRDCCLCVKCCQRGERKGNRREPFRFSSVVI
jgi:hypothetical protein